MTLTGEQSGPPTKTGLSLVDYCGGIFAALALVTGIHAARRDGKGMDCDLSLFDVAVTLLTYIATWQINADYEPQRTSFSAHPSVVPFQNFKTADGWIVVGCAKEKFWQRLTQVVGRPELAEDPRFVDFAARERNRGELLPVLTQIFEGQTTSYWLPRIEAAGIPTGPVNTVQQALADAQTAARELLVKTSHPVWGDVIAPASPLRVGRNPKDHHRAPLRNEHADEVLHNLLKYDQKRIEELASAGAFGKD